MKQKDAKSSMQLLRRHYLFAALDEAQFERLQRATQTRHLAADETLFRQGDAAPAFFVVIRGAFALYRVSAEGHEKIMRIIQPGQSFAESVMFMDKPRYPVHARAGRASQVLAVDAIAFVEVLRTSFATSLAVFACLTERIQGHWDEIEALSLQNSRYRVVHYLLGLISEVRHRNAAVTLPARKAQIAAHLALTPETLSRVLAGLGHDGLIEMHGYRVQIPDVAALRGQLG